ncbi:unnamed protein product [Prorocentrum cordatum]|uniref:Autophagy-related protein 9 n=1 Tax=Prorocentrum cordatum TaxID=2364126 RepID=A0ABN9UT09_9DINO|nr:unnamed protein product [Polarella glacialis]
MLHMSVLAGSTKLHPEDMRAWHLWTVICWSQLIIQDLLMGGLQLWFLTYVEKNGSMRNALLFSVASFILSFPAAIDPTVTFGEEDLHPLRSIAKLQHYMEQDIEDYDKVYMRILLEEASHISLLQDSPTLLRATRFKWEQEIQIQEGSAVGAYFPVGVDEMSSKPYPARVERVNHPGG